MTFRPIGWIPVVAAAVCKRFVCVCLAQVDFVCFLDSLSVELHGGGHPELPGHLAGQLGRLRGERTSLESPAQKKEVSVSCVSVCVFVSLSVSDVVCCLTVCACVFVSHSLSASLV